MQIYLNDMLYALSYALDCVEHEFLGAREHHAARVGYLCVQLGKAYKMKPDELVHLAAAAVLHDNALTEYVSLKQYPEDKYYDAPGEGERAHCRMGERNVQVLPFYQHIQDAVLYHHENADASGAFSIGSRNTPLFAQLIHLGDKLDNAFPLDYVDAAKFEKIRQYLQRQSGVFFAPELVEAFDTVFQQPIGALLSRDAPGLLLREALPDAPQEYDEHEIEAFAAMFARIIDYKSHFTCTHSQGIAEKSRRLGYFLGRDAEVCTKLYLAGALHDIGKLAIPNRILEKPDQLTNQEFDVMKTHALISWKILSRVEGLEDVAEWAGMHHEKLNGSGYPFGRQADSLSPEARLLACVDIYQALSEIRPYKEGFSHRKAMEIMYGMAAQGFIDLEITQAVDACFGTAH